MSGVITKNIVEQAADDLKFELVNSQPHMKTAYEKMVGNLAVTGKITFGPGAGSGTVAADIQVSFKMDEYKKKREYTYSDDPDSNGEIFDQQDRERRRRREILFRDFRAFAASLVINQVYRPNVLIFKKFRKAA